MDIIALSSVIRENANIKQDLPAVLGPFWNEMAEREAYAIALAAHRLGDGPTPEEAGHEEGEFAIVLQQFRNPGPAIRTVLDADPDLNSLYELIISSMPANLKSSPLDFAALHQALEIEVFVGADGTIYGTRQYEQLDIRWFWAAFDYVLGILAKYVDPQNKHGFFAVFGTSPYKATVGGSRSSLKIAIIGDWGTGNYSDFSGDGPAPEVWADVIGHNPDIIIHLGDVYYAGTANLPLAGEEENNFMALWKPKAGCQSFTLNSNHEMYGAGKGYFDVALGAGADGPFAHQDLTSYFALEFGKWKIIGLDSAYYDPSLLYMKGSLGGSDSVQGQFLTAQSADAKTLLLTHHNPITYKGDSSGKNGAQGTLWQDVSGALDGKSPDVWYWGHIHDGIIYNSEAACAPTMGRCLGHSAIPFGEASGLEGDSKVTAFAHTRNLNDPDGVRVMNGYAIIELNSNGTIDNEALYDAGNSTPIWPS